MSERKWKKSPQELINVFYEVMNNFPQTELRKMFGYPCAFINGNMCVGLHENNMIVRLDSNAREKALNSKKGDFFAPMKGRIMKEYIALSQEIIFEQVQLKKMIDKSVKYAETLPLKVKKNKKK